MCAMYVEYDMSLAYQVLKAIYQSRGGGGGREGMFLQIP